MPVLEHSAFLRKGQDLGARDDAVDETCLDSDLLIGEFVAPLGDETLFATKLIRSAVAPSGTHPASSSFLHFRAQDLTRASE